MGSVGLLEERANALSPEAEVGKGGTEDAGCAGNILVKQVVG